VILPFFAVHNYPGSYKVHGAMCQCLAFQVNLRLEATLIQVHEEKERHKQKIPTNKIQTVAVGKDGAGSWWCLCT
jgi:hypothetical protein